MLLYRKPAHLNRYIVLHSLTFRVPVSGEGWDVVCLLCRLPQPQPVGAAPRLLEQRAVTRQLLVILRTIWVRKIRWLKKCRVGIGRGEWAPLQLVLRQLLIILQHAGSSSLEDNKVKKPSKCTLYRFIGWIQNWKNKSQDPFVIPKFIFYL